MPKEKSIIQICIAVSILLLPVAHWKTILFGIPLYSVEIPVVVAFVVYLYGWWRDIFVLPGRINFRNPLILGIGAFFLGAVLSFSFNPFSWTGLGMIKTWFVVPLLAVWLWLETKPDKREIERIVFVWLCVTGVVSLASLGYWLQDMLTFDGRLRAWYSSPNYLASFVVPGILFAYYFAFHPSISRKKVFQGLLFLTFLLLTITLFLTHSYAVWASVVVAECIFLFFDTTIFSRKKKEAILFLLIAIVGIFIFSEAGSEKWQAIVSLQDRSSLASRLIIWNVATEIISFHPLFGIGIGRFQEVYLSFQSFFPPYLEWAVPQPHNLYLAVWLQTGLIGLSGFVLLCIIWLKQLFILQKSPNEDAGRRRLSTLFISMLSLFLLLGLVDTPFFKTDLAFSFWFLIALGISLAEKQTNIE